MERNKHTYSAANFYGKKPKYDPEVYTFVEEEPDELIMTDDFVRRTFNSPRSAFHIRNFLSSSSSSSSSSSRIVIEDDDEDEIITLNETPNSSAQQSQESLERRPEVDVDSIRSLRPGGMLNDTVVEFYMNYLLKRSEIYKTKKIHIFSSFFYGKLGKVDEIRRLSRTWHKNLTLMNKDYLVIPACDYAHWLLVIICFPYKIEQGQDNVINQQNDRAHLQPCLLIFDSLGYKYMTKFTHPIRLFLAYRSEYELKRKELNYLNPKFLPDFIARVPRQTNAYDCGVHLLYNFEKFLSQPRDSLKKVVEGTNLEYEWSINTREQREEIRKVCSTIR